MVLRARDRWRLYLFTDSKMFVNSCCCESQDWRRNCTSTCWGEQSEDFRSNRREEDVTK